LLMAIVGMGIFSGLLQPEAAQGGGDATGKSRTPIDSFSASRIYPCYVNIQMKRQQMFQTEEIASAIGAIILAGGKSRRFGSDKALSLFRGEPLIQSVINTVREITDNIIIISNSPEKYDFLPFSVFADLIPGCGPLGGIYTGLYYSNHEKNLVLPCDMPFVTTEVLNHLVINTNGNDITVPYHQNLLEPLCAVYSRACLPHIKAQLESKDNQVFQFYHKVKTKFITFTPKMPFYHPDLFYNINSRADLERLELREKAA